MDGFQWFILGIFALVVISGIHQRIIRLKLILKLEEKGMAPERMQKVIKAYEGDEE